MSSPIFQAVYAVIHHASNAMTITDTSTTELESILKSDANVIAPSIILDVSMHDVEHAFFLVQRDLRTVIGNSFWLDTVKYKGSKPEWTPELTKQFNDQFCYSVCQFYLSSIEHFKHRIDKVVDLAKANSFYDQDVMRAVSKADSCYNDSQRGYGDTYIDNAVVDGNINHDIVVKMHRHYKELDEINRAVKELEQIVYSRLFK